MLTRIDTGFILQSKERPGQIAVLSPFSYVPITVQQQTLDEKMPLADSYFRKGQVGSWREGMDEEVAATLCAAHSEMMGRFGYPTP